jgi:hypothetical protein
MAGLWSIQEDTKGNAYLSLRSAVVFTLGVGRPTCHEPITMLPRTEAGETSAEYIGMTSEPEISITLSNSRRVRIQVLGAKRGIKRNPSARTTFVTTLNSEQELEAWK